jgi:hypothetical protein
MHSALLAGGPPKGTSLGERAFADKRERVAELLAVQVAVDLLVAINQRLEDFEYMRKKTVRLKGAIANIH